MINLGYDEDLSLHVAAAIVDWRDGDDTVLEEAISLGVIGAESEYYESLDSPYLSKNAPFDSLSELLHVKDMTQEIFNDIGRPSVMDRMRSEKLILIGITSDSPGKRVYQSMKTGSGSV